MPITKDTRKLILDALIMLGDVFGNLKPSEFTKRVMPSLVGAPVLCDKRCTDAISEIRQHMEFNNDWTVESLFDERMALGNVPDDEFLYFLEQYVHPVIHREKRVSYDWKEDLPQADVVAEINKCLVHDGYELVPSDTIGDKTLYKAAPKKKGVTGTVKNIIFGTKYKPEVVIIDALNNDIQITKNADSCLVYDQPILKDGLSWGTLVDWYSKKYGIVEDVERSFCKRLAESMDSEPEKEILQAYYSLIHEEDIDAPALIPQIYLYLDPLTIKERGKKYFEHQRMDFLMLFSMHERVVIEVDEKQHYSDGELSSPRLYSEMMIAHREMVLQGYEVYRIGGYEFLGNDSEVQKNLKDFFRRLFKKHGVLAGSQP